MTRSSYYYVAQGESAMNLELMCLIDEQYTRTPFGIEVAQPVGVVIA